MDIESLTQHEIQETGQFRVTPVSWTLQPPKEGSESKAVCITIQFAIKQKWHPAAQGVPGTWSQEWTPGYFVYCRTYVIGREGGENPTGVEQLIKSGLWRGDLNETLSPPPNVVVILDVGSDTHQGKTYIRGNWISPNADEPPSRTAGLAPPDASLVAQLQQQYGSRFRAIGGGQTAGAPATPPAGGPQAPAGGPQAPPPGGPQPAVVDVEETPF